MKTVVNISEELESQVMNHKNKHYQDLTVPKMLIRLLFEDIKRKEADRK